MRPNPLEKLYKKEYRKIQRNIQRIVRLFPFVFKCVTANICENELFITSHNYAKN